MASFGDIVPDDVRKETVQIGDLTVENNGQLVSVLGYVHVIRTVGEKTVFLLVRDHLCWSVECVVVSPQMVNFASKLILDIPVCVQGFVSVPDQPYVGATQQVEIKVCRLYCPRVEKYSRLHLQRKVFPGITQMLRGYPLLPYETNSYSGKRSFLPYKAIYLVKAKLITAIEEYLNAAGFEHIPAPRAYDPNFAAPKEIRMFMWLCEKVANLFSLSAAENSPGVFVLDLVNRKHYSNGRILDVQMHIRENFSEMINFVGSFFVHLFKTLNVECTKELQLIKRWRRRFANLKYKDHTLNLEFEEGVRLLEEAGIEIEMDASDLNTETKLKLGKLILEKYDTDFYILHKYPRSARPYYIKTCSSDPNYCNAFDVFMRGEVIVSGGAQHIDDDVDVEAFEENVSGIQFPSNANANELSVHLRPGMLHGGFGFEVERMLMLFCAFDNIRITSED